MTKCRNKKVAVIVPCYRVRKHILNLLSEIGPEVSKIYLVDDCCPENTGDYVRENSFDTRLQIIRNEKNLGVGGSVLRKKIMSLSRLLIADFHHCN